jgi:CDP-paratose 2-epimerase
VIVDRPILITGGAGFIGCNLAAKLARAGKRVRIYDDLSRPGVEDNLAWLRLHYPHRIEPHVADIRDRAQLRAAVIDASAVYHLAAQTAVTTSLVEPRHDFMVNAGGTFELLEALRTLPDPPPLIYTSTNKVYGSLPDLPMELSGTRWRPTDLQSVGAGIGENRALAFQTPYGCSKGTADQYVLDYAQTFGIPATVFRMSCIYGPHQCGTEDQGWVAHFLIRALAREAITIYGDGHQVRDVLFVDDLVDAFQRACDSIAELRGRAFNIGGGPRNTLSLIELVELIEKLCGARPSVTFEDWRTGDQRYYVSDTRAFTAATGWTPRTSPRSGVESLYGWLVEQRAAATSPPGVIRA